MIKKLIIFDFDDTLTDNSKRDLKSFEHIIKKFNLPLIDMNKIINWRKNSVTSKLIIKKLINSNDEKLFYDCFQERSLFLQKKSSYRNYVKLKLDTEKILNKLKNDGHILALNSIQLNHNNFLNILENFRLNNYFKEIITQKLIFSNNSYQNRYNTKKILYQKILNNLKFDSLEKILVVGNLFSDIIPANDLGIESIMIKGSFEFDISQSYSCQKIKNLEEIYKFV
jgi:phosphoglycolate phosphatase-like HAD superfamily hydrolase